MSAYAANPIMLWHLIPLIAVVTMVTVNVGTNRGFAIFQARRDARRHRAALAAELASLLELMRENMRLIRTDAGYVLSGRGLVAVYRGTIGRLTFLREDEIAAVVPTYVLVERLEGLVAARTKSAGPAVYRFEAGKPDLQQLRREYHKAVAEIEKTLALLNRCRAGGDQAPASAPAPAGAEALPAAA